MFQAYSNTSYGLFRIATLSRGKIVLWEPSETGSPNILCYTKMLPQHTYFCTEQTALLEIPLASRPSKFTNAAKMLCIASIVAVIAIAIKFLYIQ